MNKMKSSAKDHDPKNRSDEVLKRMLATPPTPHKQGAKPKSKAEKAAK